MGQGKRSRCRQRKLSTEAGLTLVKRRGARRKSLTLQCCSEKVSARLMGSPGAKKTQWSSPTIGKDASALVIPLCSAIAMS